MSVGSGVCSQAGWLIETTVGTPVTVTQFHRHVSIRGTGLDPVRVLDEGVGGCADVPNYDRTFEVASQASRDIELNVTARKMGQLFKVALGSSATATQLGATAIWRQIHWNGETAGKSLTFQVGMPEATATGTNRPFTYRGSKIVNWELSQAVNELLKFRFTIDAWAETTATALASASYVSAETFSFKHLSSKIGGTPSLGSGLVSVAAGVEIAGCRGVTIRGDNSLRTDGFFTGGAGVKSEQLQNGFKSFTGDLDLEFASRSQVKDIYDAYTTVALEHTWTGADADGGNNVRLSVICPYTKLTSPGGNPQQSGPGIVSGPTGFMAHGDPAGTLPAIQVVLDSRDVAL
jgi:hypothetical protein